jgi:hypothetical protein
MFPLMFYSHQRRRRRYQNHLRQQLLKNQQ